MKKTKNKKLTHGESQMGQDKTCGISEIGKVRREEMQVREMGGKCETQRFSNDLWLRRVAK